jgi:hypothetical protein
MRFLQPRNKVKRDNAIPKIRHTLLSLAYTAVNGIIGVALLFNLRDAVMLAVERSNIKVFAFNFIEMISAVILCVAWIIFLFIAQHLYEKDLIHSPAPKRFFIITGVQLALTGLVYLYLNF